MNLASHFQLRNMVLKIGKEFDYFFGTKGTISKLFVNFLKQFIINQDNKTNKNYIVTFTNS